MDRSLMRRALLLRPEGTASVVVRGAARFAEPGSLAPRRGASASSTRSGWSAWVSSARSDVEVIALAWDCWQPWGSRGLSWRSTASAPQTTASVIAPNCGLLQERVDQLDSDSQERLTTNPLRILDSKNTTTQALLSDAPTLLEALSEESAARFAEVQGPLPGEHPFGAWPRLLRPYRL